MDVHPERVLVTGATGLIGRHLVPDLVALDRAVIAASRSGDAALGAVACDLTDPEQCLRLVRDARPHAVVHLAGGTSPSAEVLYADNVLTTVNLLQACRELPHRPHVVVIGSAAEYGRQAVPIRETARPEPVSDYGRAKLAQTMLARWLAGRDDVPLTVLRLFNVVSPSSPATTALGNLRRQFRCASTGRRRVVCGRTDVVRDYVMIEDVVAAIGAALDKPCGGETINVCSGRGILLADILTEMVRSAGEDVEVEVDRELAALPAPDASIGDPSLMSDLLGVTAECDATTIASAMLR